MSVSQQSTELSAQLRSHKILPFLTPFVRTGPLSDAPSLNHFNFPSQVNRLSRSSIGRRPSWAPIPIDVSKTMVLEGALLHGSYSKDAVFEAVALVLDRLGDTTGYDLIIDAADEPNRESQSAKIIRINPNISKEFKLHDLRLALLQEFNDMHVPDEVNKIETDCSILVHCSQKFEGIEYFVPQCPLGSLILHIEVGASCAYPVLSFGSRVLSVDLAKQFLVSIVHVAKQIIGASQDAYCRNLYLNEDSDDSAVLGHSIDRVYNATDSIYARVLVQSRTRPNQVAIKKGAESITYRELEELSYKVAAGLQKEGVKVGDRVAIKAARSIELIVCLLGILRCGASYVPIDESYPANRVDRILASSASKYFLTDDLPTGRPIPQLTLRMNSLLEKGYNKLVLEQVPPSSEAYVIFTSGSSGEPKGVSIPHRNVLSLLDSTSELFELCHRDNWTMFHSVAFDFSVWEIWGSLMTGGRLIIVPYDVSRNPELFLSLVSDEKVSVMSQTPSAFFQLQFALKTKFLESPPRLVIFGGEALDARLVLPWLDEFPTSRSMLVNMFGITETTVHVTAHWISRADALVQSDAVGFPLDGWVVEIRDKYGKILPREMPGEIWVTGEGVATGYVNQEPVVSNRFVTCGSTGYRYYKSGDLGRVTSQGSLAHMGRIDRQIQLRGFRIELQEIEGVIRSLQGVSEAAVILDDREPTAKSLCAFVTGEQLRGSEILDWVAARLPSYMVPSSVTLLDTFPLTGNGKLDRLRLLEEELEKAPTTSNRAKSKNDLIVDWCRIWENILECKIDPQIGFFALGGTSLAAINLLAAMKLDGYTISMRDLYSFQSIETLVEQYSRHN